jgi:hypothetical protein
VVDFVGMAACQQDVRNMGFDDANRRASGAVQSRIRQRSNEARLASVSVMTGSDTVSIPETSPAITAIGRPCGFSLLSKAIAEGVGYQRRNTVSQQRLPALSRLESPYLPGV